MDNEYFRSLENYIETNNLESSILYFGFHDDPISIMPCFDAVILATKCEIFGLTLPEAKSAGVITIGSNCGGVPEIITHEKNRFII